MLVASYNPERPKVDPKLLETSNFFHFRDSIAIPRMNDLIFRKRLFSTVWLSRKNALQGIKGFLAAGKQFNATMLEKDLSIQRDWVMLFGSKEQVRQLLADETRFLPPNQTHKYHEKYALIVQLAKTRMSSDFEDTAEDRILAQSYEEIENSRSVTAEWIPFCLEDDVTGKQHGPSFLAPSEKVADEFAAEVNAVILGEVKMGRTHVGLCALGFLSPDSSISDPENVKLEKRIITDILTIQRDMTKKALDEDMRQLEETDSAWDIPQDDRK